MDLIQKVRNKERLTQEEGEALYDLDLYTLGELADEIRRELLTFPEVSAATVVGARDYEISIEISGFNDKLVASEL